MPWTRAQWDLNEKTMRELRDMEQQIRRISNSAPTRLDNNMTTPKAVLQEAQAYAQQARAQLSDMNSRSTDITSAVSELGGDTSDFTSAWQALNTAVNSIETADESNIKSRLETIANNL